MQHITGDQILTQILAVISIIGNIVLGYLHQNTRGQLAALQASQTVAPSPAPVPVSPTLTQTALEKALENAFLAVANATLTPNQNAAIAPPGTPLPAFGANPPDRYRLPGS